MKNPYEDIMELPHHVSSKRPQMPMSDRAAQFSPFAALVGYDAAIKEAGRLTDERIEPEEDRLNELNMKFRLIKEHLADEPEVSLSYFEPDERKAGGRYLEISGTVKKIDDFERSLTMKDGTKISVDDILAVELML